MADHQLRARRPATSVYDLNLRSVTADAVVHGYVPAGGSLCSVQAGFEIWNGGTGLATTAFSLQTASGLPTGHITSGLPGKCLDDPRSTAVQGTPMDLWTCNGTGAQVWYSAA